MINENARLCGGCNADINPRLNLFGYYRSSLLLEPHAIPIANFSENGHFQGKGEVFPQDSGSMRTIWSFRKSGSRSLLIAILSPFARSLWYLCYEDLCLASYLEVRGIFAILEASFLQ